MPKDKAYKRLYRLRVGKRLNKNNPNTLNEKVRYLIVNDYGEKEVKYTDKVLVKSIIEKMNISSLFIPKTLALYDEGNSDIIIDKLPNFF